MRIRDIRRAAQAVEALPEFKKTTLCLRAKGQMGVNAAYAALFEPEIRKTQAGGRASISSRGAGLSERAEGVGFTPVVGDAKANERMWRACNRPQERS